MVVDDQSNILIIAVSSTFHIDSSQFDVYSRVVFVQQTITI